MTEHNCDEHGGMFEVPGSVLREQSERIAALTADLEQARAFRDECERQYQEKVAEVYALTVERDAARRDIGRLREAGQNLWRCLFGDLAGSDNDEAYAGMEWEDAYKATAATTPTADPRDAVVSAARELAQGVREFAEYPDDLILLCNLESELAKLDAAATPARGEHNHTPFPDVWVSDCPRCVADDAPARRGDSGGA